MGFEAPKVRCIRTDSCAGQFVGHYLCPRPWSNDDDFPVNIGRKIYQQ